MVRRFNYAPLILMVIRRGERRQADRLKDGDRRTCPDCGNEVEFRESYLVFRPERQGIEPAWICLEQGCGYRQFVRRLSA